MKRIICMIISLLLLLSAASCAKAPVPEQSLQTSVPDGENTGSVVPAIDKTQFFTSPASYEELMDRVRSARTMYAGKSSESMLYTDSVEEAEDMPIATSSGDDMTYGGKNDYSVTNVQVEGIDEGDIVKTDGEYIYVLKDRSDLVILKADGADTRVMSSVMTTEARREEKTPVYYGDDAMDYTYAYSYEQALELYCTGDKVAVIVSGYDATEEYTDGRYSYRSLSKVKVRFYDVSDPSSPVLSTEYSQDGSYVSSRLTPDGIYVISDYYVLDYTVLDEGGAVPYFGTGDKAEIMPLDSIIYRSDDDFSSYTVIAKISTDGSVREDSLAILGETDNVYMSRENLYLTYSHSGETESEPYRVSVYTVVDCTYAATTEITKIPLSGALSVSAVGRVPGSILNQFSLDEYNGHLRLVTTEYAYRYSTYTDESMEFTNYKYYDDTQSNALYVMNGDLVQTGAITGLADDERVYSVRFSGDTCYFVTFRETDPLFAADLSDPYNPFITGELKLPGFSNYLHRYSGSLLFGLGYDADENGRTNCLKLSMFDTSDPYAITETATEKLDDIYYSEASYNHRAILISPEKNIIAFPTERGFMVYTWDGSAFRQLGNIPLTTNSWYWDQARGLYINSFFYIATGSEVTVLDLEHLGTVAVITY